MAPMKTRWQWKLRFKSPLAPSRGVWDVQIETNSADYDNARRVADFYLAERMPHPSTRFVMLEPGIAFSEDEMNQPKVEPETGEGPKTAAPAQAPFSGESQPASLPPPSAPASGHRRAERVGQ